MILLLYREVFSCRYLFVEGVVRVIRNSYILQFPLCTCIDSKDYVVI